MINLEFAYSKNVLYYWTQLFNPNIKLIFGTDVKNNEKNILIIINFIEINMLKNNLQF